MDNKFRPLTDDELPEKLKELIDPKLQRFIDEPPGEGMGIVYVEVFPNKKMYVGQHVHGSSGLSYATTRMKKSTTIGKSSPLVHKAHLKYNTSNVRCFVLAHCASGVKPLKTQKDYIVSGDSNDLEIHFISKDGLDTLKPNGYNLKIGGWGGPHHEYTKEKMRNTWKTPTKLAKLRTANQKSLARPEVRAKIGAASKKMWSKPKHKAKMKTVMKEVYNRPGMLERRNSAISKTHKSKKTKIIQSQNAKARWSDPKKRSSTITALKAFYKTNKGKEVTSNRMHKVWNDPVAVARREHNVIVKDAKTWMPKFAACDSDDEVRVLLRQYERVVFRREQKKKARRARKAKQLNK